MSPPLPLAELGQRIMVCGPSSAGKSTLAVALGAKLGLPVIHLDVLSHLPNTDWVQRPEPEFHALHNAAILGEAWIIDGNYSVILPQRLKRATGIVLLADNRAANFSRYLRRTVLEAGQRAGSLSGGQDSIKWDMVRWILWDSPRSQRNLQRRLPNAGLPIVRTNSMAEVKALYSAWGLTRPR